MQGLAEAGCACIKGGEVDMIERYDQNQERSDQSRDRELLGKVG